MNFPAIAQEIRDIEEEGRLAMLREAKEIDEIARHRGINASARADRVVDEINTLKGIGEHDAIILLHALICQLRKHNMHQEFRQDLVHELSMSIVAMDEELISKGVV